MAELAAPPGSRGYGRRECLALMAAWASLAAGPYGWAEEDEERLAQALPVPFRSIRIRHALGHGLVVTAIAIDRAGKHVAVAAEDNQIRILSAATLATLQTLSGHRDRIRTLAFDDTGQQLVSAGNDGQLIVYRLENRFRTEQAIQGTPALVSVRFSPDQKTLAAVGFDNEVFFFGTEPTARARLQCECRDLRAVAFRPDNRLLAAAGRSGDVHLFDTTTGRLVAEPQLHRGRIHSLEFLPQSNVLTSVGEDGLVTIYDTEADRVVHQVAVTSGKLFAAAIVDATTLAVAGSDNSIHLLDTRSGAVSRKLTGHAGTVSTLAAAGGWLFSGSFDATLRRWSLGNGEAQSTRIAEKDPNKER